MKRFFAILLTMVFVFAQDDETQADTTEQIEQTIEIADADTVQAIEEVVDDVVDSVVKHRIFFTGIQTGDIPELRVTLENMIRTRWGRERNIDFISENTVAQINRKLFFDGKIVVDSALFAELEKHNLQNSIVLLISADEYSVKPVRRFMVGAGIEGKLRADFLFYDVASQRVLFAAKLSSTSLVKKPPVFWRSLQERVHISAEDLNRINTNLLNNIVEQGFETMKIAVSSRR